jgi:hypothetical protein
MLTTYINLKTIYLLSIFIFARCTTNRCTILCHDELREDYYCDQKMDSITIQKNVVFWIEKRKHTSYVNGDVYKLESIKK